MSRPKSASKKKNNDFSFYFPYLATIEGSPLLDPSSETIKRKKTRYGANAAKQSR
jgi:hypothetical protein